MMYCNTEYALFFSLAYLYFNTEMETQKTIKKYRKQHSLIVKMAKANWDDDKNGMYCEFFGKQKAVKCNHSSCDLLLAHLNRRLTR